MLFFTSSSSSTFVLGLQRSQTSRDQGYFRPVRKGESQPGNALHTPLLLTFLRSTFTTPPLRFDVVESFFFPAYVVVVKEGGGRGWGKEGARIRVSIWQVFTMYLNRDQIVDLNRRCGLSPLLLQRINHAWCEVGKECTHCRELWWPLWIVPEHRWTSQVGLEVLGTGPEVLGVVRRLPYRTPC